VQIHTSADYLNINAYALGFCGGGDKAKPGSSFNRLRAARAEHNVNEIAQLKAQLEERLAQATQAHAEAARAPRRGRLPPGARRARLRPARQLRLEAPQ
jgi:hypothetical protein